MTSNILGSHRIRLEYDSRETSHIETSAPRNAVRPILAFRQAIQKSKGPNVAPPNVVALSVAELGPYLETNGWILLQVETRGREETTQDNTLPQHLSIPNASPWNSRSQLK